MNFQDKANPLATILSAAMLLKYGLGEEKAAKRIEDAVLVALNKGFRTGDIYSAGTVCFFNHFDYMFPFPYNRSELVIEKYNKQATTNNTNAFIYFFEWCVIRNWWAARRWERRF